MTRSAFVPRLRPSFTNPFGLLPREVAVLAAVAFAVALGFGIVAPAIPVFAREFGVGRTAAGAVISAFAFMRFISALAGGQLVDRFGERVILTTGILVVAASTGLAGIADSYVWLLLWRAVGGIGSAMFTVSAVALLFRVVGAESRGRASSLFHGGFLVGGLVGPLIGGFVTEISLRLPFFLYAVSLLVAGGVGAVFLAQARLRNPRAEPDDRGTGELAPSQHTSLRETLREPAYRAALLASFGTGWALFGVRISLIPLFVTEAMDVGAVWIGVGFLCSSLAQVAMLLPAGQLIDQRGRRPAMVIGGLLAGGAMLLVAVTVSLGAYLMAMAVFGIGSAFLANAPAAVVGDLMQGRGGRVVAVFQMASDLGGIIGPLVAGALADTWGYGWGLGATAAVLFVSVAVSARMPETRRAAV